MTKVEGHEGVAIIKSVELTAFHELLNVVLDDGGLVDGSGLSSGGVHASAVSESEDVFEALVLESVGVDIDDALLVCDLSGNELVVRLAGRVNHSSEEVLLNDITCVNVAEGGNLLSMLVSLDLDHFPSEEDINTSLLALLEGDLVSVGELVDLLVGGPELNAGVLSGTALELVLAEEVLVVEGVEVAAFALVGEFRRIADKITVGVVPPVIVVVINTLLDVDCVNEHITLGIVLVV